MISWTTVVIVAAICLAFEAFFSGSEIAMVSASRARLRHQAQAGDHGAAVAEKFLAEPQVLLATTLMGTNLATVTFSVTVALALLGRQTSGSELLAIALVSPMTLIFGELVPKTLFQRHADTIVPRIIYPLRFASIVLRPGVWVMGAFAALVTRVLGVDRERAFVTKDELAMLIESEAKGETDITSDEREMISNVLELSDADVENVMVPLSEVSALPVEASIAEATLEIADKQHSRIPIYEDRIDNIVGVLHVFDLLSAQNGEQLVAELARVVPYVPENQPCVELLLDLKHSGDPMAVVVDEYGGAVGIVTVEDILEEVVGEIDDEYDERVTPYRALSSGVAAVAGDMSLRDWEDETGEELTSSKVDTIGGWVVSELGRMAVQGDVIETAGHQLHVIRVRRGRILSLLS
ncbi:MAG: hemolysin family protein, partial [Deltaproteobacteria bacterium]|nr:hemolysin family protein [Deltaproteobacteria bacterium]